MIGILQKQPLTAFMRCLLIVHLTRNLPNKQVHGAMALLPQQRKIKQLFFNTQQSCDITAALPLSFDYCYIISIIF